MGIGTALAGVRCEIGARHTCAITIEQAAVHVIVARAGAVGVRTVAVRRVRMVGVRLVGVRFVRMMRMVAV